MSSPFQQKFSAKDPIKEGSTISKRKLDRISEREEKRSLKQSKTLGNASMGDEDYDWEMMDEQKFPGDDTYTYEKKTQVDSPLDYAYVSTAPHFQRLQDNIARAFTPTKGSKSKADKEAEFKGETKKVPFESSSNYFSETGQ
jgi:hypothetical protein